MIYHKVAWHDFIGNILLIWSIKSTMEQAQVEELEITTGSTVQVPALESQLDVSASAVTALNVSRMRRSSHTVSNSRESFSPTNVVSLPMARIVGQDNGGWPGHAPIQNQPSTHPHR